MKPIRWNVSKGYEHMMGLAQSLLPLQESLKQSYSQPLRRAKVTLADGSVIYYAMSDIIDYVQIIGKMEQEEITFPEVGEMWQILYVPSPPFENIAGEEKYIKAEKETLDPVNPLIGTEAEYYDPIISSQFIRQFEGSFAEAHDTGYTLFASPPRKTFDDGHDQVWQINWWYRWDRVSVSGAIIKLGDYFTYQLNNNVVEYWEAVPQVEVWVVRDGVEYPHSPLIPWEEARLLGETAGGLPSYSRTYGNDFFNLFSGYNWYKDKTQYGFLCCKTTLMTIANGTRGFVGVLDFPWGSTEPNYSQDTETTYLVKSGEFITLATRSSTNYGTRVPYTGTTIKPTTVKCYNKKYLGEKEDVILLAYGVEENGQHSIFDPASKISGVVYRVFSEKYNVRKTFTTLDDDNTCKHELIEIEEDETTTQVYADGRFEIHLVAT